MKSIRNSIVMGIVMMTFLLKASAASPPPSSYWQQRVNYEMEIDMDVEKHRFQGKQTLTYTNNSPDTLRKVFYHLYFNAFQPGSMMDVRSLEISDPDPRVGNRISKLKPEEMGYQKINSLQQDGKSLTYQVSGTVLEVPLTAPLLPGKTSVFQMEFEGQVPLQIRRSGRNNKEGIDYSMAQWYPKISEYDFQGWHANPYIGREFHGVWGDFDVKINIDPKYIIAGTGYLQNPNEIGYGYEDEGIKVKRPKKGKIQWHFKAENVHDFVWAADPDYEHTTTKVPNGPTLRFFFQKNKATEENWSKLPDMMVKAFEYANTNFGKYPYDQYSFIQGGDGGMEYPMATLITGERSFPSLVGVSVHEMFHSWYQGALATNESLHPWMDEGFTSFASHRTMQHLGLESRSHRGTANAYLRLVKNDKHEPMTTHADHYHSNSAYSINAYVKGSLFLQQLGYIIGEEKMMQGLRRYFDEWSGKHPTPNDLMRIMEKISNIELDWYWKHWIMTKNNIDYAVKSVDEQTDKTMVTLHRKENMMMPLDITVHFKDGSSVLYYVPLRIMRGEKTSETGNLKRTVLPDWPWTHPEYTFEIERKKEDIKSVTIDDEQYMVDIDRGNNTWNR